MSAVLDAAAACRQRDPEVGMAGIAAEAGVSRITVHGRFRTRADLVEAVFEQTLMRADAVLDDVEISGDPAEALVTTLLGAFAPRATASRTR